MLLLKSFFFAPSPLTSRQPPHLHKTSFHNSPTNNPSLSRPLAIQITTPTWPAMGSQIKEVQSQEVINVSQNFQSDPIPQSSSPRSAPAPVPAEGAEDRIEESLTDDILNGTKISVAIPTDAVESGAAGAPTASRRGGSFQRINVEESNSKKSFVSERRKSQLSTNPNVLGPGASTGNSPQEAARKANIKPTPFMPAARRNISIDRDTQALGAHLYSSAAAARDRDEEVPPVDIQGDDEEDLYGATPERKTQTSSPKPCKRRVTTNISLAVAPLFPAVNTSEAGTPASQSVFLQPGTIVMQKLATGTTTRNERDTPHAISMASGNKAQQSTGKLASGEGALAALHRRKHAALGASGEASSKLFEASAAKHDPPARAAGSRASKAKDIMKDSTAPTAAAAKTERSRMAPTNKPKSREPPLPKPTQPAGRKRKAGPDAFEEGSKAAEVSTRTSKRAKATTRDRPVSPVGSTHSPAATSRGFQPNQYDFLESPKKAEPSKTVSTRHSKSVTAAAEAQTLVGVKKPVTKKASAFAREGAAKSATEQNDGGGRHLRSRKPMHQLPIDSDDDEEADADAGRGNDFDHARNPEAEVPPADGFVQDDEDEMQIDQNNSSNEDQQIAKSNAQLEHLPVIASIEPAKPSPKQTAPAGSQNNAIVLSDDSDLSSSIDLDFSAPETLPAKPAKPAAHPKTPAPIRSSPPTAFSRAGSQSLHGTGRSRKVQIIAFDKTGPLNQGSLPKSWEARTSMPPMNVPVNWGSSTSKPADMARKKASSVATSVRSGRSNFAAPPSNVAPDVFDALAGLSKGSKGMPSGASGSAIIVNTAQIAVPPTGREDVSFMAHGNMNNTDYNGGDDGFTTTMNEMEEFVHSPSPGQQLNAELEKMPTNSQKIMPPPKLKARPPRKATAAQQVSTTSAEALSDPKVVPTRASMATTKLSDVAAASSSSVAASKSKEKRHALREASSEQASKRVKATASKTSSAPQVIATTKHSVKETKAPSSKDLPADARITHAPNASKASTQPPTKLPTAKDSEQVPLQPPRKLKPKFTAREDALKTKITSPKKAVQPKHSEPARRRQNRHISQNSQTVDINGSPVPADLEVTESSTVLETFSQQADNSSGGGQQPSTRQRTPIDAANADEDAYSVPPSHQPPSMPSNTKALPGHSGSSSKTMRCVKLTNAITDQFTSKKVPTAIASDPFVSPGESQGAAVQSIQRGHLLERTLDFAREIGNANHVSGIDRVNAKVIFKSPEKDPTPEQKTAAKTAKPNASPEFIDKFASKLDRQVAAFHEATAFTRAPPEEDPDKTLVNDCSQDTEVSKETYSKSPADTSVHSTPERAQEPALSSESSGDDDGDLRSWRRKLKPHQLNLYEELVKIARVVTGYVAGQEHSTEVMIDENHRRELLMVEKEEEVQKRHYKQYKAKLQQKKNEKIREMENLADVLQGVLDASAASWEEHCRGRTEKERINREAEELVSSLS